jgi:hypothetical protein
VLGKCLIHLRWCCAGIAAILLQMFDPTTFRVHNCFFVHDAVFQVSLEENRHSKEITGVGTVSFLTTSVSDNPRLVRVHMTCRVRFLRVGCVRHPAAWLAIGLTSLRDCRYHISLHVAIDGFSIA